MWDLIKIARIRWNPVQYTIKFCRIGNRIVNWNVITGILVCKRLLVLVNLNTLSKDHIISIDTQRGWSFFVHATTSITTSCTRTTIAYHRLLYLHFLTSISCILIHKHPCAPTIIMSDSHFHRRLLFLFIICHDGGIELRMLLKLSSWRKFSVCTSGTSSYLLIFRAPSLLVLLSIHVFLAVLKVLHYYPLFLDLLQTLRVPFITSLVSILGTRSPILCHSNSFQCSTILLSLYFLHL